MSLNLDNSMLLTIAVLVILGKVYKELVKDRTIFNRKLSKFTPIVLLLCGEIIQIIYSNVLIDGILKGIVCTAISCWGYDTFKSIYIKGVNKE